LQKCGKRGYSKKVRRDVFEPFAASERERPKRKKGTKNPKFWGTELLEGTEGRKQRFACPEISALGNWRKVGD